MIGLDWDQRRDAAVNRLREATAITGCTAPVTRPNPTPSPRFRRRPSSCGWTTSTVRPSNASARSLGRPAVDQVGEILPAAELRHDLAAAVLADTADDSVNASDDDRRPPCSRQTPRELPLRGPPRLVDPGCRFRRLDLTGR